MTQQTRTTLKTYFNTGDKPSETQFANTIDSFLSLADTAAQSVKSNVTVSGAVAAKSTLTVDGNFAVNSSKFTVDATTGNTVVAGTLGVTGAVTVPAPVDPTNPATKFYVDNLATSSVNSNQDFRLTLTSGTPVTTSDVTAATTIYCTPYRGNNISLYSGTEWNVRTSAEFSLAIGTLTANLPYDVFCYDNAGTPTLEFLAWSTATARATALAYQDGVLVKTGVPTRRYMGTFYTTTTTQTEDSVSNRCLWNYYNRVQRNMSRTDSTANWSYTTATWRQANGSALNQLNYVVGVAEDVISSTLLSNAQNSTSSVYYLCGIGLDSTSTPAEQFFQNQWNGNVTAAMILTHTFIPTIGFHYISWMEYSQASGATTWYGNSGNYISTLSAVMRS